jgi:uncharacterized membrane protein
MKKQLFYFTTILFLIFTSYGHADVGYNITDLGKFFYPHCINNQGEVAGKSYTDNYSYRYSNGTFTRFGTTNTIISDINDHGEIVGYESYSTGSYGRIYSDTTNSLTVFGKSICEPASINNVGQVVGIYRDYLPSQNSPNHSFLRDPVQGICDLGLFGGIDFQAAHINDQGQIVGSIVMEDAQYFHPFLLSNGNFTDLSNLFGTEASCALSINNNGEILVGYELSLSLYSNGQVMNIAPIAGGLGGFNASLYGISASLNNLGDVVGTCGMSIPVPAGTLCHPFIYHEGITTDLNSAIDPNSGWELNNAYDINDSGQIVGFGMINGSTHGFLLTPVPEPSTLALLFPAILSGLLGWRRRR